MYTKHHAAGRYGPTGYGNGVLIVTLPKTVGARRPAQEIRVA